MALAMLSGMMPGVAGVTNVMASRPVTVRAVGAVTTGNAATVLGISTIMLYLLTVVTVMATSMTGFSKPNHLFAFVPSRQLSMMRQATAFTVPPIATLAGEVLLKLTGKPVVVAYMR